MSSQGIQIIRGCLNHLAIQYRSSGDSEFYKNRTDVTTLIGRVDQAVKRTFQEGKEKEAWKAFSKDVQPLINLKKQVCQIAQDDVRLQENLMNEVQA